VRKLTRGFAILIDYGHEAAELYSVTHSTGTLTSYSRHTSEGPDATPASPAWLRRPGEQDLTAHVDFTSVGRAAAAGQNERQERDGPHAAVIPRAGRRHKEVSPRKVPR